MGPDVEKSGSDSGLGSVTQNFSKNAQKSYHKFRYSDIRSRLGQNARFIIRTEFKYKIFVRMFDLFRPQSTQKYIFASPTPQSMSKFW